MINKSLNNGVTGLLTDNALDRHKNPKKVTISFFINYKPEKKHEPKPAKK